MKCVRLKTFRVDFINTISFNELPSFRGAIIAATEGKNVLFHNHIGNNYRYSYPLIQYKRIAGKASIVSIGEGTNAIGEFFNSVVLDLNINKKVMHLELTEVKAENILFQVWQDSFVYSIRKYLPLNQENYERYINTESVVERYSLIEKCLVGNILSFAKCMGVFFDSNIQAKIIDINSQDTYKYKGVYMMGFDLTFKTNVSLPDFIGLGRGVSVGYGMIKRIKETTNKLDYE